jgi:hypothetical protein
MDIYALAPAMWVGSIGKESDAQVPAHALSEQLG